ncbi:geranylgeranyl reductase family protein [Psychroflexus sp. YR1-1]|uniref:Geranylgeranyl reductase family protein n=1 Tax=Psychroflexus aurantiacus TaxID=2709310 RepID=A0A6B3R680_9FLAO|nr:geranylgeranyl reductase family protein [Psychroflexus aurantiacus]NEV93331.1 geranylgeranyl reductase family protein [Psychroflexus aurantiacus]
MKTYDLAIIGGGPSGASAAFEAAKSGLKTVIIEKEFLPRYKTCGGGFVFRGRKDMPFDITSAVEREFFDVDIRFEAKKMALNTKRKHPIISMIMRDEFDFLMVQKAQELGVELLQGQKLVALDFKHQLTTLTTTSHTFQAKFIIAADGALSPTAKLAGWEETRMMCPALEYEIKVPDEDFRRLSTSARFDIDVVPYGYAWSFPKKNHLSVGVGKFLKTKKGVDLKTHYKNYLTMLGITEVLEEQGHGFIIPNTPRTDGFVKQNVFLIGDAAGFADPLTAEGISNAIYSGKLAATSIVESELNLEKAIQLYDEKLNKKLLPELRLGVKLAGFFYENKTLRNILLKKHGQRAAEYMTDIFMGDRTYPHDFREKVKQKLKLSLF